MSEFSDHLSTEELSVWTDARFMPLKQRVWDKLELRLNAIHDKLRSSNLFSDLPAAWRTRPGRIYRGEHYQSYSYRSLDIIRYSSGEHLALLRLVLLWGHPVGVHLILAGEPREWWLAQDGLNNSQLKDWWLSCHDNPWVWEFPEKGWKRLAGLEQETQRVEVNKRKFLKLACFLPADQIEDLEAFAASKLREVVAGIGRC